MIIISKSTLVDIKRHYWLGRPVTLYRHVVIILDKFSSKNYSILNEKIVKNYHYAQLETPKIR